MQKQSHLAAAHEAISRQDYTAAMAAVQKIAIHNAQDPEVLRTWVLVLMGINAHPDEVLNTLAQVQAVGGMTPEMRLKRVEAQLRRGDMPAAQAALDALPEAECQSWESVALEATLLLCQGRTAEAGERLHTITESAVTPEAFFRRAVLEIAVSQEKEPRRAARQIIWETARGETPSKRLALSILSRDADLTASEAAELLDLVNEAPGAAAPELRFAVLEQVFRRAPERKAALIQAESERASTLPAEQQVRHVLFLAQQQAAQAMQDFLRAHGPALAKERPADYVSLQLEALAEADDWQAVQQGLQTEAAAHLSSLSRNLWVASAAAKLTPDSPAVLQHLKLAYQTTQNGRNLAGGVRVADSALRLGQSAFAAICYEELATKPLLPGDKIHLLEKTIEAHTQTRDTAALRRAFRALAEHTPGHPGNAYRADYLDLLYGEGLEVVFHRLQTHAAAAGTADGDQAHQRLLKAMLYRHLEHKDMLRRELVGLENATTWTAGERAVLAGLLAKAGEPARSWQLAEKLPVGLLLREEAALAAAAR